MMKYENASIVFQEVPNETTLAINITGCPCRCPGCHSPYLWEDRGTPLTKEAIDAFMSEYGSSITCIALMGGDAEPETVDKLAAYIHGKYSGIKVAWYSGRTQLSPLVNLEHLDFYKVGPYLKHLGGLKDSTTNQRIYRKEADGEWKDITPLMQRKGLPG